MESARPHGGAAPATSSPTPVTAPVMEVFCSIQGEGLWVGQPQTFLRLRGCPLRCRYCDTPGSWEWTDDPPEARLTAAALAAIVARHGEST